MMMNSTYSTTPTIPAATTTPSASGTPTVPVATDDDDFLVAEAIPDNPAKIQSNPISNQDDVHKMEGTDPRFRYRNRMIILAVSVFTVVALTAIVVPVVIIKNRAHQSKHSVPPVPFVDSIRQKPDVPNGRRLSILDDRKNIGYYQLAPAGTGSGVAAIHAALMVGTGKIVFTERWDIHGTQATLDNGLTAWSTEYDYETDVSVHVIIFFFHSAVHFFSACLLSCCPSPHFISFCVHSFNSFIHFSLNDLAVSPTQAQHQFILCWGHDTSRRTPYHDWRRREWIEPTVPVARRAITWAARSPFDISIRIFRRKIRLRRLD